MAGRGRNNNGGGSRGSTRNTGGSRRPDTGYGAPRRKKSALINDTASFFDLIESKQVIDEEEDEEGVSDYYQ